MEVMNEEFPIKKFRWMDVCIKCDTGGKLLTCHDNGCPVVVHEDCLGSEAHFDDMANFCCPFCVYKRAVQDFTRAERKAVLAEKTLSKYLDGKGLGAEVVETVNVSGSSDVRNQCVELGKDCHEVTGPEFVMRDKEAEVLVVNEESDVLLKRVGDYGVGSSDVRSQCVELGKDCHDVTGPGCIMGGKGTDVLLVNKESDVLIKRVGDNGVGSSDVHNQCVELEKDCHEVTGLGCIMRDKGADVLVVKKKRDVLLKRVGDNGVLNDGIDRVKVLEKQNELESVVRGRGDECREGKVDQQKDVDMKKKHQSEEKIQNDAVQTETVPEHHQDAGRYEAHKIMKENVDVEAVDENEGRTDEVQNQEQAHKMAEKIVCKESASRVHMEANRKVDDASTCMDTSAITEKVTGAEQPCFNTPRRSYRKRKAVSTEKSSTPQVHIESASQLHMEANSKADDTTTAATSMDTDTISEKVTGPQPPCVNSPRRSSRKTKSVHIVESSTPRKSSKVAKPPTIFTELPIFKEKRKRLAWKVEEEEMLKKGVQKYSKSANKNLPWQKILEEGRVAFDETRTPADLKDKWKNNLSKEPSL
ncbi:hypothetical protein POM88_010888 [Heracleum sosnowskyi]|uniref:Myb-like domain-containing protein n=1 Tax=Heracleum sosnowskyi TaxID=360622 RepID=A0AAD8N122_9APIA|nr:hypothetical protein POM88_010888 [Heracleum sosnowskyi]